MTETSERSLNLALRGATLVSRFGLVFVLAKFLEPRELGLYGLLAATISYALMAVGFDFYTYSTREMIVSDSTRWAGMLRDQAVFYLVVYAVAFPLSVAVFWLGYLPWNLAPWFFALLALEHLAQELNRLLVAMSAPVWASGVLFLRSGLWAIAVTVLIWLQPGFRSIEFVFGWWLLGTLFACIFGLHYLRRLDRSGLAHAIDWSWIRRGARVALPFVVATLCLRGLYTFDRYWIEALGGLDILAAYVLFMGFATAILNFLDAAVFSFVYPRLVAAAGSGDGGRFSVQLRTLAIQTGALTIGLVVAVLLVAPIFVNWLERPVYREHMGLLGWTLLAAALSAASMVPHFGLYARRRDRTIVLSHVFSLAVFFVAGVALVESLGPSAVPAAVAVAFTFQLVTKSVALAKCGPMNQRVEEASSEHD